MRIFPKIYDVIFTKEVTHGHNYDHNLAYGFNFPFLDGAGYGYTEGCGYGAAYGDGHGRYPYGLIQYWL